MKSKAMKLYEQATDALRKEITKKLKKLLKGNSYITFKESVFTHLITDDNYVDLKRVDRDMLFHGDHKQSLAHQIEMIEFGLEEFDASALYEILLALEEKRIEVVL